MGADIRESDQILAANGEVIDDWSHFVSVIQQHPEQDVSLKIQRGTQILYLTVRPEEMIGPLP